MSEETVPKRQYTEEFKLEAVRLADSVGGHEAARRLGIPIATLSNWSQRRRKALGEESIEPAPSVQVRRSPTDLEAENSRLRKKLASARDWTWKSSERQRRISRRDRGEIRLD